jgi:hypothetical protein
MSQDQFNIKKFLKENQSGPYGVIKKTTSKKKSKKSLNENYVDLRPVGGGNTFKGYTNELREDETYLGPKKPAPDKIYAEPEPDHEQEVGDNAWMKNVNNEKVGEFTVNYEHPGIITWDLPAGEQNFFIAATPKWDGQSGTPIEAIFPESNPESIMITIKNQDEFVSFEEYAETVYPIIKQWMNQNSHEEMDEDYKHSDLSQDGTGALKGIKGVIHPDDLEEFDAEEPGYDDEIPYHDRFWEIGGREILSAVENLLNSGFHMNDIIEFIKEI